MLATGAAGSGLAITLAATDSLLTRSRRRRLRTA
jgi:hypothetical protein